MDHIFVTMSVTVILNLSLPQFASSASLIGNKKQNIGSLNLFLSMEHTYNLL